MRILPREQREAMFEIYAFCRAVDDIADDPGPREERLAALEIWRGDIAALYASAAPARLAGLARAVRDFDLGREDFLAIIDGMEMDVRADIRAPDQATLDAYCDRVACAVGRLSVRVFGMPREAGLALARHAENPHRKPADRASDPVAIKVKRRAIRGADIDSDIHLHAVDDGKKILALQIEFTHCPRQAGEWRRRCAGIDRIDIAPPFRQCRKPRLARAGIVGDVIDGAAEGVDFEHRLALRARQNPHAGIERAAGGARRRLCRFAHSRTPRLVRGGKQPPAETLRSAA